MASLIFLSVRNVLMALIRPMVPMEIRSSMLMPVFSKRRAMYTTSRRFRSMRVCRTDSSPPSSRASSAASSSRGSGGGRVSLPPIYMTLSGLRSLRRNLRRRCSSAVSTSLHLLPLRVAPQGVIAAAVTDGVI